MAKNRLEIMIISAIVIALGGMYAANKHLFRSGEGQVVQQQPAQNTIPPQVTAPSSTPENPTPTNATPTPVASPPEFIAQPCLVLFDHVPLIDEPKVGAKKVSEVSSGQIVHLEHTVQPGDKTEYYGLSNTITLEAGTSDSKASEALKTQVPRWIEASKCLLFDQQSIFDNYINSTSDISNVWNQEDKVQTPEDQKKVTEVNGLPFLERTLLNADSEVTAWAANRYFTTTPIDDTWTGFFKLLKIGKLSREILFDPIRAAIENNNPPPTVQKFKVEFNASSVKVQNNLLQNFCEILILNQNSYLISVFDSVVSEKRNSNNWSLALDCLGKFDTGTEEVSSVVKYLKSKPFRSKLHDKERSGKLDAFFKAHEVKK